MKPLSIRWRMTLWNTLAFALVLVVFGIAVYGLLRRTHLQQIDRGLTARFDELARLVGADDRAEAQLRRWMEGLQKHPSLTFVVCDSQGSLVVHDPRLDAAGIRLLQAKQSTGRLFVTVALPGAGQYRLLADDVSSATNRYTVLLAASLEHVNEEMGQVVAALAVTIPVTLLVAAGLAYILARKSLAPIDRLRRLTAEITVERLGRRLPIDNPHDELGLLTATINDMSGRLERSFAEVRRFTADASHELRTPVTVIRAEVEEYLDRVPADGESRLLLHSILEECERLTSLTDRLLVLCREDANVSGCQREPVHLAELVEAAVEMMAPLAEAKQQRMSVTADRTAIAMGQSDRLRDAVQNLLDNAIKYTPSAGTIQVRVEQHGDDAVVTVCDTGMGIPQEHLPRIFDRFYRVENSRSRTAGGAGLGLSIAQAIVMTHGGRIEVTSTPGKGSTFRIFLPRLRQARSASHGPGAAIRQFLS